MHFDSEATRSTPQRVLKLRRLGTRRLARAHVTLSVRPQVGRLAREALSEVCSALGKELGCPVSATAGLLESVVIPGTALSHTAAFALVELAATGGTAVLELEPRVLFAALERLAGSGQKPTPVTELTRLEEASFAYLGLSALCALRRHEALQRRLGPRLTGVTMSRAEALSRLDVGQRHLEVELTVTVGQTTAGGRLMLPAVVLEGAVKDVPAERDEEIAPEVLAASLEARCRVGRTPLSRATLEGLHDGDVVVFEGLRVGAEGLHGPGRLVLRGFELTGEFGPEGFSLNRARRRALFQEQTMMTVREQCEDVPSLPVDVEVELTRLMVPLSELATLKPGALLSLHINASEPVLLRVGERAVAKAELVDIEGEVGARILTLLP